MYKLVCLDLDGTLLNDKKELTAETTHIIDCLIDQGVEVVIATGRQYDKAKHLIQNIHREVTIIANNGAVTRKKNSRKLLRSRYLESTNCYQIYCLGKSVDMYPYIYVDYLESSIDVLMKEEEDRSNHLGMTTNITRIGSYGDYNLERLEKVLSVVYISDYGHLQKLMRRVLKEVSDKLAHHIIATYQKDRGMMEFMNEEAGKWIALSEYCQKKFIQPKEIVAIGDDNNDLEMILKSGYGIAMKNATSFVKERADRVAQFDNNQDGAVHELRRIFQI